MNNLWKELKRRNVMRVAVAYAVVSWVVLQFVDISAPLMGLPEVFQKGVFILVIILFPIALILSWAYEITPEGVKKTAEVDKTESITPKTGQRINKVIAIGLVLALAFIAYDKIVAPGPGSNFAGERKASIAVLPFADLSAGQDQGYFADGISEEILNVLAQIPDLKVAGRTSSFKFKGRNEDLRVIGEQLGVAHVLEGSVRKDGGRIRITVQLVAADDGFHLWSETYDRELTNIFAIQDQISRAVAEALQVQLGARGEAAASVNIEAYNLYLRARQILARRGGADLTQAVSLLEAAVLLDPEFAAAHALLGRAYSLQVAYTTQSREQISRYLGLSLEAAERALALDPASAEAWSVIAITKSVGYRDWEGGREATEKAVLLSPNDAEIANFAGDYYTFVHDWEKADYWEEKAVELNPLFMVNYSDLANLRYVQGRTAEALALQRQAFALNQGDPYNWLNLTHFLTLEGETAEARELVETYRRRADQVDEIAALLDFIIAVRSGDMAEATERAMALQAFAGSPRLDTVAVAELFLELGDDAAAARYLERSFETNFYQLLIRLPSLDPADYEGFPRFRKFLERPELTVLNELRRRNEARNRAVP